MRSLLASRLVAVMILGALTVGVRMINHQRVAAPPDGSGKPAPGWITSDPDAFYHLRRVQRALEEGCVAGSDPLLPAELDPEGRAGPIPWPPYATWWNAGAVAVVGLLSGEDPGNLGAGAIERGVAGLPMLWAALAALLAFAWAERTSGGSRAAGWFAALSLALHFPSLRYSYWGMGDHHACASALIALALALASQRDEPRGRSAILAGLVAGLALGTWVGALPFVVLAGMSLAWSGQAIPAAVFFSASFLALVPAWATSPWRDIDPWSWVEISHLQPVALLGGALLSVLLRKVNSAARASAWIVSGGAAALLTGGAEVLDWGTASTSFMSSVRESRTTRGWDLLLFLGPTVLLAPIGLVSVLRSGREPRSLWWLLGPAALLLASLQQRFGELVAVPLLVLAAVATRPLWDAVSSRPWLAWLLVPALASAGQCSGTFETWRRLQQGAPYLYSPHSEQLRALRAGLEWLGDRPRGPRDEGVLAAWDLGHAVEWVARRPTAATNFGSYLGEASFEAPRSFFHEHDPREAERQLERGGLRYVLLTSTFARLGSPPPGSIGARLIESVGWSEPGPDTQGLDFLRLVYLGPQRITPLEGGALAGRLQPSLAIWERVPGQRIEVRGEPGEAYSLSLRLTFPLAQRDLIWSRGGHLGDDGRTIVRAPYAPAGPGRGLAGGQGQARADWRWKVGARTGSWSGSEETGPLSRAR